MYIYVCVYVNMYIYNILYIYNMGLPSLNQSSPSICLPGGGEAAPNDSAGGAGFAVEVVGLQ